MLIDIADLHNFNLQGVDGDIGRVEDAYFSDDDWTVRYLVVDTGRWFPARKVLISPRAVQRLDTAGGALHLSLTRDQIKNSPAFDSDRPVSRQYEGEYFSYYGYPHYWAGPYLWGVTHYPVPPAGGAAPDNAAEERRARLAREREAGDPHLRSANEVTGYTVQADDGEIGHVETFLFDEASWAIGAIVVDTKNWWPGKHVVISPLWIEAIDWSERRVRVGVSRERIKSSAEYEPGVGPGPTRDQLVRRIEHVLHFGD